jgi:hypothetical protein
MVPWIWTYLDTEGSRKAAKLVSGVCPPSSQPSLLSWGLLSMAGITNGARMPGFL